MVISVKELEESVANLPPEQLKEFRSWYEEFDIDAWDRQIENDALAGKLDSLAEAAIADHQAGQSTKL